MFNASDFVKQAGRIADLYTGVPCSFLKPLINYVIDRPDVPYAPMNNEGEAIAFAAGAFVAGRRPVVMLQNSGVGNMVNPITSLLYPFRIPVLLICTWRAQPGIKDEPQHELMGRITAPMLELMGVETEVLGDSKIDMEGALCRADAHMRRTDRPYGLVLPKGIVEDYRLGQTPSPPLRSEGCLRLGETGIAQCRRYQLIESICRIVGESHVIVGTTGKTGRELFTCRDSANHLYMVGSMGCAASFGLGMAMHLPPTKRVVVIDGDGAALMRLEAMASIGYFCPKNLVHLILDNRVHDSTGGQQTLSTAVAFDRIAHGCGYAHAVSVVTQDCFEQELDMAIDRDGPTCIHAHIVPGSLDDLARPSVTPCEVKQRLMEHLRVGGHRG